MDVIAGPLLPGGPAEAPDCSQDVVAGAGGRAVFLSQATVPANRDNGGAAAIQDGRVTTPGVEGAVACQGTDLFMRRDLIQPARQHGAVTLTT